MRSKMAKMKPKMAKMRPKMANTRPKMAKIRPKMAKLKLQMAQLRLKMAKMRPKMAKMRPKMSKTRPKISNMKHKIAKMTPKVGKMTPIEKTLKKYARKCVCMHASAPVASIIEPTARRRQDEKKGQIFPARAPQGGPLADPRGIKGKIPNTTGNSYDALAGGLANFFLCLDKALQQISGQFKKTS